MVFLSEQQRQIDGEQTKKKIELLNLQGMVDQKENHEVLLKCTIITVMMKIYLSDLTITFLHTTIVNHKRNL
jgi:hypothetical protein